MALDSPTTSEISDQIIAGLQASIGQTIPILPKSFARVLAKVLAAVFILLYKYAGFIFLQLFVAHASMRETTINGTQVKPLVVWGQLIGVGDPTVATQAELVIDVTVTNQTGSLAAGSLLIRSATGIVYTTIAAVLLDAPTVQATMRAVSDQDGGDGSGVIGNLEADDVVSFANPPPNVATDAVVVSQAVTGADGELEADYRARILQRFQAKPQGGAYADYREWGEEVAGVLNIYPYTGQLPGEVDVYVESTVAIDPDGIPTQPILDDVFDAIELDDAGLASRRPANAAVNVYPITRAEFDLTISGLDPETAELQTDIETAADEYLRSREPFIVGLSVLPRKDRIITAELGGIVAGIVHAAGATVTTVTLTPGPAHTLSPGEKAKLGTTTYI
jgi:uncharacterized phage protein gp47/JayE